jgi:hypothetical protein
VAIWRTCWLLALREGPNGRLDRTGLNYSIVFFAPPVGVICARELDSCNECLFNEAQHALDHHKWFTAYQEYSSSGDLEILRNAWLQPESQTLEEMYWIAPFTTASE